MARVCFLRILNRFWFQTLESKILDSTCCIRLVTSFDTFQQRLTMLDDVFTCYLTRCNPPPSPPLSMQTNAEICTGNIEGGGRWKRILIRRVLKARKDVFSEIATCCGVLHVINLWPPDFHTSIGARVRRRK